MFLSESYSQCPGDYSVTSVPLSHWAKRHLLIVISSDLDTTSSFTYFQTDLPTVGHPDRPRFIVLHFIVLQRCCVF